MHGGAFEFAFGLAFLDVVAFVEFDFSFADAEGDFDFPVFPVEGEGKEGVAFDGGEAEEFADLGFVEEEFAGRFGLVAEDVGLGVFVDVGVVEPDFVFFDAGEGVLNLGFASAEGFDFGTAEDDPGFEGVEDVVVAPGFVVLGDVSHADRRI